MSRARRSLAIGLAFLPMPDLARVAALLGVLGLFEMGLTRRTLEARIVEVLG